MNACNGKKKFIFLSAGTSLFKKRFFQLPDQDHSKGKTFLLQYLATNPKEYGKNIQHHTPVLQGKAREKRRNQFIEF
jgi:hypothetical protein